MISGHYAKPKMNLDFDLRVLGEAKMNCDLASGYSVKQNRDSFWLPEDSVKRKMNCDLALRTLRKPKMNLDFAFRTLRKPKMNLDFASQTLRKPKMNLDFASLSVGEGKNDFR